MPIYTCIYTRPCPCPYSRIDMSTHVSTHIHAHLCTHVWAHDHTHVCAHVHTYDCAPVFGKAYDCAPVFGKAYDCAPLCTCMDVCINTDDDANQEPLDRCTSLYAVICPPVSARGHVHVRAHGCAQDRTHVYPWQACQEMCKLHTCVHTSLYPCLYPCPYTCLDTGPVKTQTLTRNDTAVEHKPRPTASRPV